MANSTPPVSLKPAMASPLTRVRLSLLALLLLLLLPPGTIPTTTTPIAPGRPALPVPRMRGHGQAGSLPPRAAPGAGDLALLKAAVRSALTPGGPDPSADREVASVSRTLAANGTWPDVDYTDASRSWWFAAEHLRRCLLMASAFVSPYSVHRADPSVRTAAERAVEWWLQTDPQNQWWWMQIGVPRILAKYLLLLPNATLTRMAAPLLSRTPLYDCRHPSDACGKGASGVWTGCNRVWGASFHVMLGAMTSNATHVAVAYSMAHSTLEETEGCIDGQCDGIQADSSFHQHGPQLYSGWGYGGIYSTNVLVLESYAVNTSFAMSAAHWTVFSRLVLNGQAPATRGANFDFLACGRLFTYFRKDDAYGVDAGHYHYFAAFTPHNLAFPVFAPPFSTPIGVFFAPLLRSVEPSRPRASEFEAFSDRLLGLQDAPSSHVHYYNSDYTAHHRPAYSVFVHMLSNRTLATECVNTENKRGRQLADGVTTVYSRGAQYESVFPVLNWTTLPGTTEAQSAIFDRETSDHQCGTIRNGDVRLPFVGGLSDGLTGVSAMDFARDMYPSAVVPAAAGSAQQRPRQSGPQQRPRQSGLAAAPAAPLCNASTPAPGQHCDLATDPASLGASFVANASGCRDLCCGDPRCNCWTWTSYSREASGNCLQGGPCCRKKASAGGLVRASNCTGGLVFGRPVAPPPPPPPRCIAAAKAWFFLDNATIAMGAGVTVGGACLGLTATTSLQQSNLRGTVFVGGGAKSAAASPIGNETTTMYPLQLRSWVWHDGVVLAAVGGGSEASTVLQVSTRTEEGTEYIITQGDNATIRRPVFAAQLNHPAGITNGKYAYLIAPAQSALVAKNVVQATEADITIVSNTPSVQAVCDREARLMQAVFRPQPMTPLGVAAAPGGASLVARAAGCWDALVLPGRAGELGVLLQMRERQGGAFEITVSLPAQPALEAVTVRLELPGLRLAGGCCKPTPAGNATAVTVALPAGRSGGTSVGCGCAAA